MRDNSKQENKSAIKLDGINLTIKGHKFTMTMEELRKLSDEIAKVIPPQVVTYPVIIKEVQPYDPEPCRPWIAGSATTPQING